MRKLIILFMVIYIIGFSGCTGGDGEQNTAQQANAQISEEAYNCVTFFVSTPTGWKIQGNPGTNTIVGHAAEGSFDKKINTYWDLKVTTYVNDKDPGKDFPKSMAKTIAHRKGGKYVGKMEIDNVTLYEADYTVGTFTQKEFFGISSVKGKNGQYKYYNIDFTLCNCPDDFSRSAMKLLNEIQFNFTFDF